MISRGTFASVLLSSLLACAPSTSKSLERHRDAIVGGTDVTTGDDNVFLLIVQPDNAAPTECSATLIGARSLITASHCVDPVIFGATSLTIDATNVHDEADAHVGVNTFHVIETRHHPSWDTTTLVGDVAFAYLDRAPPATPKEWSSVSISGYGGRPIRSVGYGTTGASMAGGGVKRTVGLTIRQLTPTLVYLGNQIDKGICHGDSGGPSFHTFGDGVERLIGVHSFTRTQDCLDGADTRADAYAGFITQWLDEKEGPSCQGDGRCKPGCLPADPDCVCVADGLCTTDCTDFTQDPDCPANCGDDGICATEPCPRPDPDCVAELNRCAVATDCMSRKCVVDLQHGDSYCARTCTQGSDCADGTQCDGLNHFCRFVQLPSRAPGEACVEGQTFCTGGSFCAGTDDSTTCVVRCTESSECPNPQPCVTSVAGPKFCQPPAPIVLGLANIDAKAGGCSSTAGAFFALSLLWFLPRSRKRLEGRSKQAAIPGHLSERPFDKLTRWPMRYAGIAVTTAVVLCQPSSRPRKRAISP